MAATPATATRRPGRRRRVRRHQLGCDRQRRGHITAAPISREQLAAATTRCLRRDAKVTETFNVFQRRPEVIAAHVARFR